MLLLTLAISGSYPTATSVGKLMSDPLPTIALMPPAAAPAARIQKASRGEIPPSQHAEIA